MTWLPTIPYPYVWFVLGSPLYALGAILGQSLVDESVLVVYIALGGLLLFRIGAQIDADQRRRSAAER